MNRIQKYSINKDDVIMFFIVLSIITTSGSNWSIFFLVVVAILTLCINKRIEIQNYVVAIVLSVLLFVNSYITSTATFDTHEYIVYVARFFGVAMVSAAINYERFMKVYVQILYCVFAVTLIFWMISLICNLVGGSEPFSLCVFDWFLMESKTPLRRLKSIFWEGGVCAIHANIALTFCIYKGLEKNKYRNMAIIFILAVICSVSTTGYIVLGLQLILYCARHIRSAWAPRKLLLFAIMIILLFIFEEITIGVVVGKIFGGQHSASSRFDDTVLALAIARDHFLCGIGVAADTNPIFLDYFYNDSFYLAVRKYYAPDLASSNGLGNCMYKAGIPFTLVYLGTIYRKLRINIRLSRLESLIIFLMYVCFFIGEPIMPVPLMLMFFYKIDLSGTGCGLPSNGSMFNLKEK